MNTSVTRVHALINRAADHRTPEEERRTSGVLACVLIRRHGLDVVDPVERPDPPPVRDPPPPPKPSRRRIHSQYDQACTGCGHEIEVDDVCWWRRGEGVVCPSCYRVERAS